MTKEKRKLDNNNHIFNLNFKDQMSLLMTSRMRAVNFLLANGIGIIGQSVKLPFSPIKSGQ